MADKKTTDKPLNGSREFESPHGGMEFESPGWQAVRFFLAAACSSCSEVEINRRQKQLAGYMAGILEWNKKVNITSITNTEDFIARHYLDSLTAVLLPEMHAAKKVVDLGTGGGFPGIPLAAAFPVKDFLLADSLNKRLEVIDLLSQELGIDNIHTVHGRAEELGQGPEYREQYDLCVSRAVSDLSVLAEYCLPLVKVGGSMIAYKGPDCQDELQKSVRAVSTMGGEIVCVKSCDALLKETAIPRELSNIFRDINRHNLVIIHKLRSTPVQYPRRPGKPYKNPIK